jgi:hypothetical protein
MITPAPSRKPALSEAEGNWSIVCQTVGYHRYHTPGQLTLLNSLYAILHFYANVFIPLMKLKEKIRIDSRGKCVYDDPQTPYARVLVSPHVSVEHKDALQETYSYLDPVRLRMRINYLLDQLLESLSER